VIAVTALERHFGEFALGPLSLEVETGEYRVLLGPSGAGKSMLLHTLAGGFEPERGTIALDRRDITRAPPEAREVGLVFQQSALFPHLSVGENLAYGLRARRVAAAERDRRVSEVVAAVRIESLLSRPTATLSGGEAQKVALARALAIHPRVLLLDEPLGPIDHDARQDLITVLERVHRDLGLTTLHVTHSRDEARALADRCTVMLGGRLVQSGTTEELFARPRCAFVARFLGAGASAVFEPPDCGDGCVHQPGHCSSPM
jgi:ABC-type Fe3+/spermidine/putrescine transport system ATPase subunit